MVAAFDLFIFSSFLNIMPKLIQHPMQITPGISTAAKEIIRKARSTTSGETVSANQTKHQSFMMVDGGSKYHDEKWNSRK